MNFLVLKSIFTLTLLFQTIRAAPSVHVKDLEQLPGLVEGDMLLRSSHKNGIINPAYLWPNATVIFELDPAFSADERQRIFLGWDDISDVTCITFRERTVNDSDFVYIQRGSEGSGCYSEVGRMSGRQILNYEPRCIDRHGTITHEMLHTLGFYHEQSRPDRDDYVTVVWDKIEAGLEENFFKYNESEVTTFGAPYDYGSVMHYPPVGFSIDGTPTLIPKIPGVEIGQRIKISQIDVGKAILMYNCPQKK